MIDTTRSKGWYVILAPEIAEKLGCDSNTLIYFTWLHQGTALRVYKEPDSPPILRRNLYTPGEVEKKIMKAESISNKGRPDLKDYRGMYNLIRDIAKEWGLE